MIHKMPPRKRGGHNKGKYFSQISKKIDQELKIITDLTDGQVPRGTLVKIARINNVSREYVRQKANKLQLITYRTIAKTKYCINCKNGFTPNNPKKKYCSPKCLKEYARLKYWLSIKCKVCGKEISYLKSNLRIPVFCSRKCQGKNISKQWSNKSISKTKEELIKDLGQEFTAIDFAGKYKISYGTACNQIINLRTKGIVDIKRKKSNQNIYKIL